MTRYRQVRQPGSVRLALGSRSWLDTSLRPFDERADHVSRVPRKRTFIPVVVRNLTAVPMPDTVLHVADWDTGVERDDHAAD